MGGPGSGRRPYGARPNQFGSAFKGSFRTARHARLATMIPPQTSPKAAVQTLKAYRKWMVKNRHNPEVKAVLRHAAKATVARVRKSWSSM